MTLEERVSTNGWIVLEKILAQQGTFPNNCIVQQESRLSQEGGVRVIGCSSLKNLKNRQLTCKGYSERDIYNK